ncbi:hypothetical protein O9K51_09192 [Purpureocillium lavendulum]|uniref:Uncharacterized protein n=1 Tax=Purpureocillium lavendulum TaxID=1247861 RepID=A0AB34FGL1_9HYPO|nr:hypothetical protein O9K51_09192 [Purpureocillium lavendulum]
MSEPLTPRTAVYRPSGSHSPDNRPYRDLIAAPAAENYYFSKKFCRVGLAILLDYFNAGNTTTDLRRIVCDAHIFCARSFAGGLVPDQLPDDVRARHPRLFDFRLPSWWRLCAVGGGGLSGGTGAHSGDDDRRAGMNDDAISDNNEWLGLADEGGPRMWAVASLRGEMGDTWVVGSDVDSDTDVDTGPGGGEFDIDDLELESDVDVADMNIIDTGAASSSNGIIDNTNDADNNSSSSSSNNGGGSGSSQSAHDLPAFRAPILSHTEVRSLIRQFERRRRRGRIPFAPRVLSSDVDDPVDVYSPARGRLLGVADLTRELACGLPTVLACIAFLNPNDIAAYDPVGMQGAWSWAAHT